MLRPSAPNPSGFRLRAGHGRRLAHVDAVVRRIGGRRQGLQPARRGLRLGVSLPQRSAQRFAYGFRRETLSTMQPVGGEVFLEAQGRNSPCRSSTPGTARRGRGNLVERELFGARKRTDSRLGYPVARACRCLALIDRAAKARGRPAWLTLLPIAPGWAPATMRVVAAEHVQNRHCRLQWLGHEGRVHAAVGARPYREAVGRTVRSDVLGILAPLLAACLPDRLRPADLQDRL